MNCCGYRRRRLLGYRLRKKHLSVGFGYFRPSERYTVMKPNTRIFNYSHVESYEPPGRITNNNKPTRTQDW